MVLGIRCVGPGAMWVVAVLLISSLLNVFYLLPVAVTAFFRSEDSEEGEESIKEAPWPCVVPLAFTALGCFALFFWSDALLKLAGVTP